jgi:hypothetical protein
MQIDWNGIIIIIINNTRLRKTNLRELKGKKPTEEHKAK